MARVTTKFESNADIVVTEFLEKGVGKEKQFLTIYSGVDVEKFREAQPVNLGVPVDHFKVLMASRLTKGKGFEELIQAAKKVLGQEKRISFLIAGEGELENSLKGSISDNGLQDHFHLLGYRADLHRVMKSVDLFVLPSHVEGTPRVIAEAMAAGLPVTATRVGSIPEQVEDGKNGVLIEPKALDQLTEAILKLSRDLEMCKRMGRESYTRVEKSSLQKMIRDVDALYESLLSSKWS